MKTAYLDAFSGLSGNMFLGALVDAGVPETALRDAIAKIDIKGFELKIGSANKCGIQATHIDVDLTSRHHHRGLTDILKLIRAAAGEGATLIATPENTCRMRAKPDTWVAAAAST